MSTNKNFQPGNFVLAKAEVAYPLDERGNYILNIGTEGEQVTVRPEDLAAVVREFGLDNGGWTAQRINDNTIGLFNPDRKLDTVFPDSFSTGKIIELFEDEEISETDKCRLHAILNIRAEESSVREEKETEAIIELTEKLEALTVDIFTDDYNDGKDAFDLAQILIPQLLQEIKNQGFSLKQS